MRKEAPSVHFSDLPFDGVYNYNSHVAAHGPFSHLLTQQEGKATAKRCALSLSLSLPCTSQGYGLVARASGRDKPQHIRPAAGPRALPGLSALAAAQGHLLLLIQRLGSGEGRRGSNGFSLVSLCSETGSLAFSQRQGARQPQPLEALSSPHSLPGGQMLSWERRGLN